MKVGVWSYYSVDRPPVKFHRVRSPFDAPTDNYNGSIAGLTSDVFGLRKLLPSFPFLSSLDRLHSSLPTARSNLTSLVSPQPPSRASESCPEPDPGSRHHWVRIIPKHLQNVSVLLIGLPNIFFLYRPITIEGTR